MNELPPIDDPRWEMYEPCFWTHEHPAHLWADDDYWCPGVPGQEG